MCVYVLDIQRTCFISADVGGACGQYLFICGKSVHEMRSCFLQRCAGVLHLCLILCNTPLSDPSSRWSWSGFSGGGFSHRQPFPTPDTGFSQTERLLLFCWLYCFHRSFIKVIFVSVPFICWFLRWDVPEDESVDWKWRLWSFRAQTTLNAIFQKMSGIFKGNVEIIMG